jgi:hypothetical protein
MSDQGSLPGNAYAEKCRRQSQVQRSKNSVRDTALGVCGAVRSVVYIPDSVPATFARLNVPGSLDSIRRAIFTRPIQLLAVILLEPGHPLVEVREHTRPCLVVAISRLLIREAGVGEAQRGASAASREFDGYHGFDAFGGAGEPGHFHQPIGFEPQEPAIVEMPASFELRFEIEDGVDRAFISTDPVEANQRLN